MRGKKKKSSLKLMRAHYLSLPNAFLGLLLAIIIIAVFYSLPGFPQTAFAEEGAAENVVNPQQLPDSSFIYDVSIIDLSTADAYYDDQTVQVFGEVIGDSIKAGEADEFRWITLLSQNADTNATVSVHMRETDAEKIDSFGKYGQKGTTLLVRGTYHLTCTEHEGLSDVHAEYVEVYEPGKKIPDEFNSNSFIPGVVLVVVGLMMLFVFYKIREGRR